MTSEASGEGRPISDLRSIQRVITTHTQDGKATALSVDSPPWQSVNNGQSGFSVAYTTSEFPVSMTEEMDVRQHENLMASQKLGLVNPHGTVCRFVDFKPGRDVMMHRTRSLDYGIVIEGSVEMILDDGEVHMLRRGDIAIQRATNHGWRNPSPTEWARMLFVLQDCQPVEVGGQLLDEDISNATKDIPASRH